MLNLSHLKETFNQVFHFFTGSVSYFNESWISGNSTQSGYGKSGKNNLWSRKRLEMQFCNDNFCSATCNIFNLLFNLMLQLSSVYNGISGSIRVLQQQRGFSMSSV